MAAIEGWYHSRQLVVFFCINKYKIDGWWRSSLIEKWSLSFSLLRKAGHGAIPPANVGIGWAAGRPESSFLLCWCDGQMSLDVKADGNVSATIGVFSHDQLAKFGFQCFVECVLVDFFLMLAAVDVLGRLQLRRMHPWPVNWSHGLGFLAAGCRLLVVVAFSQKWFDQLGDGWSDFLGDETKFLGECLGHHF